ncbi:MAG: DNA-directed RNA polymerase subunit K [Promethearchaeota archaeon]
MSSFLESRELRKKYKEVKKYLRDVSKYRKNLDEETKIEIDHEIGSIFLTRYEKARIVGARALQISFGAPILVEKPKKMIDPIKIAQLELKSRILPLTLRREYPSGEFADIPIKNLLLKKD